MIRKLFFESALREAVVGCGIQGAECLAMEVVGKPGLWEVRWSQCGELGNPSFSNDLSMRVGKHAFWVPPTEDMAAQTSLSSKIDVAGVGGAQLSKRERVGAMCTQIGSRLEKVTAEEIVVSGMEMVGPDGKEEILVGGGARKAHIREDYRNWRKQMGIRYPHIAASATALANLYVSLYEGREGMPRYRLLVVEGRMTTHAVLMDEWRFVDALEYGMMERQTHVEQGLLDQWVQYYRDTYALTDAPVPLVVPRYRGIAGRRVEEWHPFESSTKIRLEKSAQEMIVQNLDLAAMAFGMALQGGR